MTKLKSLPMIRIPRIAFAEGRRRQSKNKSDKAKYAAEIKKINKGYKKYKFSV